MSFPPQHDLHRRRFGRNVGLALVLVAFVGIVFGLTLAKTKREGAAPGTTVSTGVNQ